MGRHVFVESGTILGHITDTEGGRPPHGRNLHPYVYEFAVGEASFLKCISSSRSLTIEALINAEINFCQCTSRAQSVLFLQEPRPLTRTERAAGMGELCRNKMKHQSQFVMPGDQELLEKQLYP